MGYSAGTGVKGLDTFNNTPQTTADLQRLVELIARVGNYRGAVTESERDAVTGSALYAGLMVNNTTNDTIEVYDGSDWVPWVTYAYASLGKSTTQAVASSTPTDVSFNVAAAARGFSVSLPATSLTIPSTGDYELSASCVASQTTANYLNLYAYLGATLLIQATGTVYPHTGEFSKAVISPMIFSATGGQLLKLSVITSSAATIGTDGTVLTLRRVG